MKGVYIRVKINEVSIMFAGSWIKRQFFSPILHLDNHTIPIQFGRCWQG